MVRKHGYPLYDPEPHPTFDVYRTKGIRIGDVGQLTLSGAFETLFNVRALADHPVNYNGVPGNFEGLYIAPDHIEHIPHFFKANTAIVDPGARMTPESSYVPAYFPSFLS